MDNNANTAMILSWLETAPTSHDEVIRVLLNVPDEFRYTIAGAEYRLPTTGIPSDLWGRAASLGFMNKGKDRWADATRVPPEMRQSSWAQYVENLQAGIWNAKSNSAATQLALVLPVDAYVQRCAEVEARGMFAVLDGMVPLGDRILNGAVAADRATLADTFLQDADWQADTRAAWQRIRDDDAKKKARAAEPQSPVAALKALRAAKEKAKSRK